MRNGLAIRCLAYPAFLAVLTSGCLSFRKSREVTVQVLDAETGKPVAGAEVRVHYPLVRASYAPPPAVATAGTDGIVQLKTAQVADLTAVVEATAAGYLCAAENLPVELEATTGRGPAPFALKMFAGPRPTVELVLPDGYRGVVKVQTRIQDDAPCTPGQRLFRYEVPSTGTVLVVGPPLFRRSPPEFQARHVSGAVLGKHPRDTDIGFWWLQTEAPYEVYVVGTHDEFLALRPDRQEEEGPSIRPAGGSGGRRGGRGGGGSPGGPSY
jgi:hypothetical protein